MYIKHHSGTIYINEENTSFSSQEADIILSIKDPQVKKVARLYIVKLFTTSYESPLATLGIIGAATFKHLTDMLKSPFKPIKFKPFDCDEIFLLEELEACDDIKIIKDTTKTSNRLRGII